MKNIVDVEAFWDENPLFTGEVDYDSNDPKKFFEAHNKAYFEDVFSGINFDRVFSMPTANDKVLDLGCGIGFWSSLFVEKYGVKDLSSADLSENSLRICKQRVPQTKTLKENAENLSFSDESFSFINCQGVIHHTPNTQSCLNEIYRVLAEGGTASISVYYDNFMLRMTNFFFPIVNLVTRLLLRDKGRGRDFSVAESKEDIVRLYDGANNPIGKSYSKQKFVEMLRQSGFDDINITYFFFPFRFMKLPIPEYFRRVLVRLFPFMIVANVKK